MGAVCCPIRRMLGPWPPNVSLLRTRVFMRSAAWQRSHEVHVSGFESKQGSLYSAFLLAQPILRSSSGAATVQVPTIRACVTHSAQAVEEFEVACRREKTFVHPFYLWDVGFLIFERA